MPKPQFHHLSNIIAGLVNVSDDITISKIAQTIADAKDKSCIYKFLSRSKWEEKLIDRNRLSYLNLRFTDLIKPNTTGFLIYSQYFTCINKKPSEETSYDGICT